MNKLERSLQKLYQKIYYRTKGARENLVSHCFQTEYDRKKNFTVVTLKAFEKKYGRLSLFNSLTMILDNQGGTIAIQENFKTFFYILDEENIYEMQADEGSNYSIIHHYYDEAEQKFNSKEIYTTSLPLYKENFEIIKKSNNLVCFELDGMNLAESYKTAPRLLYNQSTREGVIPFHNSSFKEESLIELHTYVYFQGSKSFLHFFVDKNGKIVTRAVDSTKKRIYEVGKNDNGSICFSVVEDLTSEEQQQEQQKTQAQLYNQQPLTKVRKQGFSESKKPIGGN